MKVLSNLIIFLISTICFAQQGINYKAIIKDAGGNVLSSSPVTIQFIIYESAALTINLYQENHTTNTDSNGIVIVNIGEGVSGDDFSAIDWASGERWLDVQINTGAGLVALGATPFKAVPYAIHSKTAETAQNAYWEESQSNIFYSDGLVGVGIVPSAPLSIKGSTGFASSANSEAYSLLVDDTGNLSFHANNMNGTGSPTLTLDDSSFKRVGIGITFPQEKLHIATGGVRIDETTSTPAPKTAYGNALPIAYGYFGGTIITENYGISSITNPSTGNFNVTLDNNFLGSPVVMLTSFNSSPAAEIMTYSYTAPNIIEVHVVDGTGAAKNSNFSLVVFGVPQ
jgi:hypothetical protein